MKVDFLQRQILGRTVRKRNVCLAYLRQIPTIFDT